MSVDAVLEERLSNRGLRVHKLVSEALELVSEALGRTRWCAFRKWNEHHAHPLNLDELAHLFEDLRVQSNEHNLKAVLQSRAINDTEERYIQCCQSIGANGQLWSSYLDTVDLILQLIRSSLEANWELHVVFFPGVPTIVPCLLQDQLC